MTLTNEEFVKAMKHLLYEAEPPQTPEEVDAFLRSEGLDPDEIGRRGKTFVEKKLAEVALREAEENLRHERAWAEIREEYDSFIAQCPFCCVHIPPQEHNYWAINDQRRDAWFSNPDNHFPDCVLAVFYRAYDEERKEKGNGQESR